MTLRDRIRCVGKQDAEVLTFVECFPLPSTEPATDPQPPMAPASLPAHVLVGHHNQPQEGQQTDGPSHHRTEGIVHDQNVEPQDDATDGRWKDLDKG